MAACIFVGVVFGVVITIRVLIWALERARSVQ